MPSSSTLSVADEFPLVAGLYDHDGERIQDGSFFWYSTNPTTALIDSNGIARAIKAGTAKIIVVETTTGLRGTGKIIVK
jgi:uncharacterized protein YjdB